MEIKKANWSSEDDNYRIDMPLTKVDTEKRLVSGFASLDNIDQHGDIILADANKKAFSRFRGNIREMHQPIAVGKMVDFKEDTYFDKDTKAFYKGIFVTAYISPGAESTWQKVLDGTLSGFSIGGKIREKEDIFDKSASRPVRVIKDYDLQELSLVDNPANQFANVFSISKSADGQTIVEGLIADVKVENVLYCTVCKAAKTTTEESSVCPEGDEMTNIGWFEYANDSDKADKAAEVVTKYVSSDSTENDNEGGNSMTDENTETPDVTAEVEVTEQEVVETDNETVNAEVDENATVEDEVTEKAAEISEVADEPDLEKMFVSLQNVISEGLQKSNEATREAIAEVVGKVEEFTKSLGAQVTELADKYTALSDNLAGIESQLGDVEKRIDSVEDDTAIKKSSDLGGSTESTLKKSGTSKWNGTFLDADTFVR